MACQLCATRQQSLEDTNQTIDAKHVTQGRTILGLPVEAAAIADFPRAISERNSEPLGDFRDNSAGGLAQMNVLVRVEVSRSMSHQAIEQVKLSGDFVAHRHLVLQWNHAIEGHPFSGTQNLFAEIDM